MRPSYAWIVINGSGNELPPFHCQAITWTGADLFSAGTLRTYISEIWINSQTLSLKKMLLKLQQTLQDLQGFYHTKDGFRPDFGDIKYGYVEELQRSFCLVNVQVPSTFIVSVAKYWLGLCVWDNCLHLALLNFWSLRDLDMILKCNFDFF